MGMLLSRRSFILLSSVAAFTLSGCSTSVAPSAVSSSREATVSQSGEVDGTGFPDGVETLRLFTDKFDSWSDLIYLPINKSITDIEAADPSLRYGMAGFYGSSEQEIERPCQVLLDNEYTTVVLVSKGYLARSGDIPGLIFAVKNKVVNDTEIVEDSVFSMGIGIAREFVSSDFERDHEMNYVGERPNRDYTMEINGKPATPNLSMTLPPYEWTIVGMQIEDVPELLDYDTFAQASIDGLIGITARPNHTTEDIFYYIRFFL